MFLYFQFFIHTHFTTKDNQIIFTYKTSLSWSWQKRKEKIQKSREKKIHKKEGRLIFLVPGQIF